ncbi:MAG: hypothetical protein ACXQTS_06845 [Candidatus Methanospirareceae archaeon]
MPLRTGWMTRMGYLVYEYLGLHGDALRVMIKAGLKNKDDYLRLARALIQTFEPVFRRKERGMRSLYRL